MNYTKIATMKYNYNFCPALQLQFSMILGNQLIKDYNYTFYLYSREANTAAQVHVQRAFFQCLEQEPLPQVRKIIVAGITVASRNATAEALEQEFVPLKECTRFLSLLCWSRQLWACGS
eukprot:4217925-Amphidinium_carterae.1